MFGGILPALDAGEFDLTEWLESDDDHSEDNEIMNHVHWGNGLWVAAGSNESGEMMILTSVDGENWDRENPPDNITDWCESGLYAESVHILCSRSNGRVYSSGDASTWVQRALSEVFPVRGIAHDGTTFVVVGGAGGSTKCNSSADGLSWSSETMAGGSGSMNGITFGNGIFVSVGNSDGTNADIATSSDGSTWTDREPPTDRLYALQDVIWSESLGLFFACGEVLTSLPAPQRQPYLLKSSDGITWSEITVNDPAAQAGHRLTELSDGSIILHSYQWNGPYIWRTYDGSTWDRISSGAPGKIYRIHEHDGVCVAAAEGNVSTLHSAMFTAYKR